MWSLVITEVLRASALNVRFGIGFVLDRSDNAPSGFYTEARGTRYFLVNPFGRGLMACKTVDTRAFDELVSSACHEIAHMGARHHDGAFIVLNEQLIEATLEDITRIKRNVFQAMRSLCP